MSNDDCQTPDYPAAHSMDSEWFAVDKDGFVAMLTTNEEGAMPLTADQDSGNDQLEEVAALVGRPLAEGDYGIALPESVGVYNYEFNLGEGPGIRENAWLEEANEDWPVMPYRRKAAPENPINISDLPANVRNKLSAYVFKNISFKDCLWVQPALHVPCQFWTEKDFADVDLLTETGEIVKNPTDIK